MYESRRLQLWLQGSLQYLQRALEKKGAENYVSKEHDATKPTRMLQWEIFSIKKKKKDWPNFKKSLSVITPAVAMMEIMGVGNKVQHSSLLNAFVDNAELVPWFWLIGHHCEGWSDDTLKT